MDPIVDDLRASDAFATWVRPHVPDLWRFAVSLTGFDAADDLVQECLARAWTKREQFDADRGSARSWLFAIMADRARRGRLRRRPKLVEVRVCRDGEQGEPGPLAIDLRRAVDSLPNRQRLAVTLRYYLDLTLPEIAELMDCSLGTVKSTLHDARSSLSELLGGGYD